MRLVVAEILLSLLCFALQEVPRGHGLWTLAGVAVIGAALPVLVALGRRPRDPPPRRAATLLGWALGALVLAQLGFGLMRAVKVKVIDIGATTLAAIAALVHGGNPYALPIDLIADGFHGYKYLPVTMLTYAPLAPLGLHGMVLTNIVLQGATAAALGALAARRGGRIAGLAAAVFYLSIPFFSFQLFARGVNDLAALLPILLALLVLDRRPFAAGVLVALSLAAKLMPGAAAVLALLPAPRRRRTYLLGAGIGFACAVFPFLAWDPENFIANIVLFNALRPVDDTSWLWQMPAAIAPSVRGMGAFALAALYLQLARRPPAPDARLAALAAAILIVFAAGPDMHHNYYLWFLPLLMPLAAWAALGERE